MTAYQWGNSRTRVKIEKEIHNSYYVASGTRSRVLEEGNPKSDIKNHITRQDLIFTEEEETTAPPGWRAFKRSGYIIQFEDQDVFYKDLWALF